MTTATAIVLVLGALGCTLVITGHIHIPLGTTSTRRPRPDQETSWQEAVRILETRIKAVETEWDDVYEKLRRVDRRRGGEARATLAAVGDPPSDPAPLTRSEILRRHHVQALRGSQQQRG